MKWTVVNVILQQEELFCEIIAYWEIPTLVRNKRVCKAWERLCTEVIVRKSEYYTPTTKAFENNTELQTAVIKYTKYRACDVEYFARNYGYPIGRWNVSRLTDFSSVFQDLYTFDEDISTWDVSKATNMSFMFLRTRKFNQDISSWDTSNVVTMKCMFGDANNFNQNISTWNTSRVRSFLRMFRCAVNFDQDISSWNTSNVRNMAYMFEHATNFDQDLSDWDFSNVNIIHHFKG